MEVVRIHKKTDLYVTLVDAGGSGNCFYYSLYGAAKYSTEETPTTTKDNYVEKDHSSTIFKAFGGTGAYDKERFISVVRTHVANQIKKDPSVFFEMRDLRITEVEANIVANSTRNEKTYKSNAQKTVTRESAAKTFFKSLIDEPTVFDTWLDSAAYQVKAKFGPTGDSDFIRTYRNKYEKTK